MQEANSQAEPEGSGKARAHLTAQLAQVERATEAMAASGMRTGTIAYYRSFLIRAARFAARRGVGLVEADEDLLADFAAGCGPSFSTRRALCSALGHFYDAHSVRAPSLAFLGTAPPARLVALPRPSELLDIARQAGGRRGLALALVAGCGLSAKVVSALRYDEVTSGVVRIAEHGRVVEVALHPVAAELMREHRGRSAYVFPSSSPSGHVRAETVAGWLAELCAAGGLPRISTTMLRNLAPGAPLPATTEGTTAQRAKQADSAARPRRRLLLGAAAAERVVRLRRYLLGEGCSDATIRAYCGAIRKAEAYYAASGLVLPDATAEDLAGYVALLPQGRSTLACLRHALRSYYLMLGRSDPPLRAIRVPRKAAMECRALEPQAAGRLVAVAAETTHRGGLAVLLGLYLGLRRFEIAKVRWDDIDGGWLKVLGKGNKPARIPIHPDLGAVLGRYPATGSWLFPAPNGRDHVCPMTIWGWVKAVGAEAGIADLTTHQLRHTCLATANDNTGDLRAVMELARHARPETTAGYTRTTAARLTAVAMSLDYGAKP